MGMDSLSNLEEYMENENTLRRLKTIEGHLRGVIRMVEEDTYCIDIIRQIGSQQGQYTNIGESFEFLCNNCHSGQ
jgi:DNA-binding FrmR family transcriptional regulator